MKADELPRSNNKALPTAVGCAAVGLAVTGGVLVAVTVYLVFRIKCR